MNESTAFHTAARRYCQNEHSRWTLQNSYPRYQFAETTQFEIEKLIPTQFQSMGQLRPLLLRAGELAREKMSTRLTDPEAQKEMADQASHYRAYIMGRTVSDLAGIEPLPHRRVLDEDERRKLWDSLKQRWDLDLLERGINVLGLDEALFKARHGVDILRDALMRRGISNVLQFERYEVFGPDLEVDVSIFEPCRSALYSTSNAFDWVVLASLENSITIAGKWLEETFKQRWPDWNEPI